MTFEKIAYLAKNKVKTMILTGLFLGALSFLFLVVSQKNFKISSDFLVVQNQAGFSDYYALSKTADYLSGVLMESIYTEKFLEEIDQTGIISTEAFLPKDKIKRLEAWSKMIKISKNPNLGMVHIEILNNNQKQGMDIANAVLNVITTKHYTFLGRGQYVDVRILNGPIWEKNPSIENVIIVVIGGIIIGMILSFIWLYYKEEKYASNLYLEDLKRKMYEPENF